MRPEHLFVWRGFGLREGKSQKTYCREGVGCGGCGAPGELPECGLRLGLVSLAT